MTRDKNVLTNGNFPSTLFDAEQNNKMQTKYDSLHTRYIAVSVQCVGCGCGLWAVGCGLWAVGCGLWAVDCGLWAVGLTTEEQWFDFSLMTNDFSRV